MLGCILWDMFWDVFHCMTSRKQHAAKTEELLKEGCRQLTLKKPNGSKVNIKGIAALLKVAYTTLRSRFLNIHKPCHEAHTAQQFLSPTLEQLLVKWIIHLGSTGHPLCKWTIKAQAQHLHPENKKPSRNWIYLFLKRHPNIVLSTPCGLDPKRAKAFNCPVINRYFDELTSLIESMGIPIENIYNMDEKGCQRGGRKKGCCRKYFYSRKQRAKYKHRCYAPQAYLSVSHLRFQSAYYMCTTGPLTATTGHLLDLAAISMISSYSLNASFLLYLPVPDLFPMSTQPPSLGVTSNDSCMRESILYYSD